MKHLKLFEDKAEQNYEYQWLDDAIEEYFFKDFHIAHSETLDSFDLVDDGGNLADKYKDKFVVVLEYFTLDLNVKYMSRIIEYMKFVDEYGKYKFFVQDGESTNDTSLGIEAIFDISKLPALEKFMVDKLGVSYSPNIKKYNL